MRRTLSSAGHGMRIGKSVQLEWSKVKADIFVYRYPGCACGEHLLPSAHV